MSIDALDPIPDLDAESMFLCAALWVRDTDQARTIADLIEPGDFERPAHASLYTIWRDQITASRPHDAASIAGRLTDAGTERIPATVHTALRGITTLGAPPEALGWYGLDVVTAAYRRSYIAIAESIAHAAAAAPTDDLFPILVEHGKAQRTQSNRLDALRIQLGAETQEHTP